MNAATIEALIAEHFHRVHRAAVGFLGEREAARDAAQEAMMKAYAARDRYDPKRPFYPWMYRIVKNTCLDILRQKKRRPQSDIKVEQMATSGPSPHDIARETEDRRRLWAAMTTLNPDHREILNLRHFQDLSYTEIARTLGVAEGTVMSRLYRARRALASAMNDLDKEHR
ncbi:MAG: sigma-70 family RNA polymerase sigma factor [Myxococcota bacterium]